MITLVPPSAKHQAEQVAKCMVWLAYQASVPVGMGRLHYRQDLTEETLWAALKQQVLKTNVPTFDFELYLDYCFGRMMKFSIVWSKDAIYVSNEMIKEDYQSWAREYHSYARLYEAAIRSFQA